MPRTSPDDPPGTPDDRPDRPDERPERPDRPPRPDRPRPPKRPDRRRPPHTPFLVIRYQQGDTGGRPIPSGSVFWHSPDVWVVSSLGKNQPVAGEENRVFARITNRGQMDAAGVTVRYWWANPSIAITEVNAHLIGTATGKFIAAGYTETVECPVPWVPVIENDGHECVLAEAWVPYFDPLIAPLDVVVDRHVGQQNLHVVDVAPGQAFSFSIEAFNITPFVSTVIVQAMLLPPREVRRLLHEHQLEGFRPAERVGSVELGWHGEPIRMKPSPTYARRLLGEITRMPHPDEGGGEVAARLGDRFEPWEGRTVAVTGRVPREARRGEVFGIEVSQRVGGLVSGGYLLLVGPRG